MVSTCFCFYRRNGSAFNLEKWRISHCKWRAWSYKMIWLGCNLTFSIEKTDSVYRKSSYLTHLFDSRGMRHRCQEFTRKLFQMPGSMRIAALIQWRWSHLWNSAFYNYCLESQRLHFTVYFESWIGRSLPKYIQSFYLSTSKVHRLYSLNNS